jgi:hypothetical protein
MCSPSHFQSASKDSVRWSVCLEVQTTMEAATLAEIFMMRLEAAARAAGEPRRALASSASVFVPYDTGRRVVVRESKVRLLNDAGDAVPTMPGRASITD